MRVSSLVPVGYGSYTRILHPAENQGGREVTWREVAAEHGGTCVPTSSFSAAMGMNARSSDWAGLEPEVGKLPLVQLRRLMSTLADLSSSTQRCWSAVWDGYGVLPERIRRHVALRRPGRAYIVFQTALMDVAALSYELANDDLPPSLGWDGAETVRVGDDVQVRRLTAQSPNVWWSSDGTWWIATEVDADSTIVGGPVNLGRALRATASLECLPLTVNDELQAPRP